MSEADYPPETTVVMDHEAIEAALRAKLVDELGVKPKFAFGPARVAVTGSRVSPPLFESMEVLGRESTLARLARLAEAFAQHPMHVLRLLG